MRGQSRRDRHRGRERSHPGSTPQGVPGYDRRHRRCRPGTARQVAVAMQRPPPRGVQAGGRMLRLTSNWQREQTRSSQSGAGVAPQEAHGSCRGVCTAAHGIRNGCSQPRSLPREVGRMPLTTNDGFEIHRELEGSGEPVSPTSITRLRALCGMHPSSLPTYRSTRSTSPADRGPS